MDEGAPITGAAIRDHLANERTLLSWQRTALTVIGLGFIVDRFAFEAATAGTASIVGLGVIVLGASIALLGARRYVRTEREIDTASYRPSITTHLVLTGAIVAAAVLLVIYLLVVGDSIPGP
ncbi:MAG: DUF202 domain-containing protein [Chloroflexi bacterium]|nr:DUF202 domain-containing protein [Chloroflexota bacterium]